MLTIPLQRFYIIAIPITFFLLTAYILKLYDIDFNETIGHGIHNMDVLKIKN